MADLSAWSHYKAITVQDDNVDAAMADFPLYVPVAADAQIGARARADGHDLRLTLNDGCTLLEYEREYWDISGGLATGHLWVKVPSIAAGGGAQIRLYYGNPDAEDGEAAAALWSDYVGVFHLREDAGPYLDSRGVLSDGRTGNDPVQVEGMVHKSQDFNGSDQSVIVSDHPDLDFGGNYGTWQAWVKFDSLAAATALGARWETAGRNFLLRASNTPQWQGYVYCSAQYGGSFAGVTAPNTSDWFHVALVLDAGVLRCYVNGQASSTTYNTSGNLAASDRPLRIGDYFATSHQWLNGRLDEFRLRPAALSAAWLKFEHANIANEDHELTWGAETSNLGRLFRAVAGGAFVAGASAGQDYHAGATAGVCHE